jgi:hypothetical protein
MIYMVESALTGDVLFRRRFRAYPRVLLTNSAGNPQTDFSRIPQQIREFSSRYAHDLRAQYQQEYRVDFRQLFRAISTRKKGEKQAESGICGKARFGGLDHKV